MATERNHTLDAMRGVAALAVVAFHGAGLIGVALAPHGYLAVDLFFALSGYVVAQAYDPRLRTDWRLRDLAKARLARFYPLYLLGLLIGLAREVLLIAGHNPFALTPLQLVLAVGCALLFVPFATSARPDMFGLNVPSWSLMFELLVNLAYGAAFPWLGRRALAGIAVVAAVAFIPFVVAAGTANLGAHLDQLVPGALRTLASFSAGAFIFRSGWGVRGVPAPLLLVAVALLLAAPAGWSFGYDLGFMLIASPLLVMAGARASTAPALVPLFRYLGIISFPIYAVHRPLQWFAQVAAERLHLPLHVIGIASVVALLVICPWLHAWYDRPAVRWIDRRLGARRDPAPMAAP